MWMVTSSGVTYSRLFIAFLLWGLRDASSSVFFLLWFYSSQQPAGLGVLQVFLYTFLHIWRFLLLLLEFLNLYISLHFWRTMERWLLSLKFLLTLFLFSILVSILFMWLIAAVAHSGTPYVQIGLIIVLYIFNLFIMLNLDFLLVNQYICLFFTYSVYYWFYVMLPCKVCV